MADITVPETGDNAPADAFDTNAPLFNPQTTGPIPDQNDAFGGKVEAPKPLADVNFYTAQDDLAQRAAKATEEGDMQKAARIRAVAEHFSTSRYQAEQELDYRERVIQRERTLKSFLLRRLVRLSGLRPIRSMRLSLRTISAHSARSRRSSSLSACSRRSIPE